MIRLGSPGTWHSCSWGGVRHPVARRLRWQPGAAGRTEMLSEHFAMTADALRNRYRVERLLQSGVAAYVYLANDRAVGRRGAVQVLRDEMSATVDADRFMSEINLVRQLRHPNIVPLYESGEIDGTPYYVMPF